MKIDTAYEQDMQLAASQEQLDLLYPAAPVKSDGEAAADAALQVLDPSLADVSEDELTSVRFDMSRFNVEQDMQGQLEAGTATPESVEQLRTEYVTADPDRAVVGALKALNPEERVPKAQELKAKRLELIAAAREAGLMVLDRHLEEDTSLAGTLETARTNRAGEPETTVAGALSTTAQEAARVLLLPTQDATSLAMILGAAFPDLRAEAMVNLGSAVAKARVQMHKMDPEEAKSRVLAMDGMIEERIQFGWTSELQEWDMRETLFYGLKEGGAVTDLITTGAQWLENLLAVPILSGWAKAVGSVGKSISRVAAGSNVGLVQGTKIWAVSQTTAGVEALAANLRNRALDTEVAAVRGAAKIEDIIDSIAMPKFLKDQADGSGPYVPSALVPQATRDRLLADPAYVHGTLPTHRINQATVSSTLGDGAIHMDVSVGTVKGLPYKTQASAQQAMKRAGWNGTVVPEDGGFRIRLSGQRQFGLAEAGEDAGDLTNLGYRVFRHLGKNLANTKAGIQSSNIAARETEKAAAAFGQLLKPLMSLPAGSQRKVARILDKGDGEERLFSIDELRGMGLNDLEIQGYAASRRAVDVQADLTDVRLWHKYTAAGYRSPAGSNTGIKILSDVNELPASTRAVMPDGSMSTVGSVQSGFKVGRLLTPDPVTGARYAIMADGDIAKLGNLPRQMTNRRAGYLPRDYRYPHYVKLFEPGSARPTTIMPARSQLEADQIVKELSEQYPGKNYRSVQASELRQVDDLDELEAMDEAGLLFTNKRGPSKLFDAAGGVRLPTVEDRLLSMVADASMSIGIQRWGDAQKLSWQARHADLFSGKWTPGVSPGTLEPTRLADAAAVARAKNEAHFINNVLGVGDGDKSKIFGSASNWIADRVYNTASRLDRGAQAVRGGKASSQLGNDLRNLGDNINGLSGRVLANSKTLPYLVYLASNPIRQLPLQMTLIPSYFGVQGGGRYLLGGFQKDFATLMVNGMVDSANVGNRELVDQFRRSGLMDSLEHHTLLAGIGGHGTTTVSSQATQLGRAVSAGTTALTRVGIGAGIQMEKVSAWLIARNRWLVQNPGKKIDPVAEREIASFAEELSLNPNRSDSLPMQHGLMGVFTQFLSMQAKQIGRTLQAVGAPTGSLSRGEALRMAAINLGTYGVAGYGVSRAVVGAWEEKAKELGLEGEWMDVAFELLNAGAANFTVDALLTLATGDTVDSAFTESFSPNAQIGGTVRLVDNLAAVVLHGEWSGLGESRWQAPALGLAGNVVDVLKFGSQIAGAPPLPTGNSDVIKTTAVAKRAMQILPGLNNFMKHQAAVTMRAKFTSTGAPLVEATMGEALLALAGVKTTEELATWEMSKYLSPGFGSRERALSSVRDHAYDTAQWMLPLLDEWVGGKITYLEAGEYIDTMNQFTRDALGDGAWGDSLYNEYASELKRLVDKRWRTKYNVLVERMLQDAGTGRLPITEDSLPKALALIPDPEKRDEMERHLRRKLFGEY